jgi:hypothetical protein
MSARSRRVGLLAAAVAGVLGVLAIAWMLREQQAAAEQPTPQPSASTPLDSPEDPEVPPAEPARWAVADWVEVDGGMPPDPGVLFRIDGMVDVGDEFVAWGRIPMPGRNQFNDMGAVFVSADGRSWRTIAVDHGVNAKNASEIVGVAAGPGGYLAFGGVCCDPETPAIWHSTDLVSWTRLMLETTADPPEFYPTAIVGGPDGWVAVGNFHSVPGGAIWASDDGDTWGIVMRVDGGPPGLAMADVAMTPDGPIAVGSVTAADGSFDGAVWKSTDGRAWERVAVDDPALVEEETQLLSVIPHVAGVYLSGIHGTTERRRDCEAGGGPAATSCAWGLEHGWVSVDGGWDRVDPAKQAGERPIEFRLIASGGPGLVLLGESSGEASPDTTLYTSPDGRVWTPVAPALPMGDDVAMGMAVRDREVVVIADAYGDDPEHPRYAVWVATAR